MSEQSDKELIQEVSKAIASNVLSKTIEALTKCISAGKIGIAGEFKDINEAYTETSKHMKEGSTPYLMMYHNTLISMLVEMINTANKETNQ